MLTACHLTAFWHWTGRTHAHQPVLACPTRVCGSTSQVLFFRLVESKLVSATSRLLSSLLINLYTMSFAALWCTCDMPTRDSKGQSCTGIKGRLFHKHICALVLCTPQLTLQWFCGVIDCEVIRAYFKLLFLLQSGPVHPLTWNLEGDRNL